MKSRDHSHAKSVTDRRLAAAEALRQHKKAENVAYYQNGASWHTPRK